MLVSEHFDHGFGDGMQPRKLHDPGHSLTSEQKAEYTRGFTVARDFRIDGKREFEFGGQTYKIALDRPAIVRKSEATPEDEPVAPRI